MPPVASMKKRPLETKTSLPDPPARVAVRPPSKAALPYTEWVEGKVSEIFAVTLKVSLRGAVLSDLQKDKAIKADWRLCWLRELEEELSSEGSSNCRCPSKDQARILE